MADNRMKQKGETSIRRRQRSAEKSETHLRLHGGDRLDFHLRKLLGFRIFQLLRGGNVPRLRADDGCDSSDGTRLQ